MPGPAVRDICGMSRTFSLKRLITSPRPCQVIISSRVYDMKFVMTSSALEDWMLARGCGNALVGVHGMLVRCQ